MCHIESRNAGMLNSLSAFVKRNLVRENLESARAPLTSTFVEPSS